MSSLFLKISCVGFLTSIGSVERCFTELLPILFCIKCTNLSSSTDRDLVAPQTADREDC